MMMDLMSGPEPFYSIPEKIKAPADDVGYAD